MKMVNKNKGKPRAQVEAESLKNRNLVLAFVRRHDDGADTDAIVAATGCTRSTLRMWLLGMVESGHVTLYQTEVGEGRYRNIWSAGTNTAPLEKFTQECLDFQRKDPVIRRSFVKAKQVGMSRDSLVAALFGPAVRA